MTSRVRDLLAMIDMFRCLVAEKGGMFSSLVLRLLSV